ncbi:MAG TPA: purine-nucleoside phosphorylase [Pantanalinema sp.]
MSTTATLPPQVLEVRARIADAAAFLRARTPVQPKVGLILGSGLGALVSEIEGAEVIPYAEIPHFPVSTAPGHAGNLVFGMLGGQMVMAMQGRFHLYEGYTPQQVTFPVRVMRAMGVETLVVTCATGGLNKQFQAGDLMLIKDHLNLMGDNPLIGANDPEVGPRFPVMFDAYRSELRAVAHEIAKQQGITLHEGVYAGITGPAFFTPAELQHLVTIGADAIGMSVVFETIVAIHCGLKVVGLGLISDMALPDGDHHATEQEVLEVVGKSAGKAKALVRELVARL